MSGEGGNEEAHRKLRWILDNADAGFFIVTAPHWQQRRIADLYKSPRIACYDYSPGGEAYSYYALSDWADAHRDADALFVLNMQVALQQEKNLVDFNMSRDMLAQKDRAWFFFMSKDAEHRLSTFAHDIYSYVRMKAHFQAEEESAPKEPEMWDSHDRLNVQRATAMLEQYKELEARHMSLSLNDTPDSQLLSAAMTLSDIAELYKNCAKYDDSLRLYDKILQIRKKALGDEHLDTATAYNEIAVVCSHQGDYPKALELHEKALAINERALGKEHPDTAATYNNIALVYSSQGDYPKALEWHEKALAIRKRALGKEHPDTATTYNNIAGVYDSQGDYAKALEWYGKDLAICERVLGKEHPDTATTYNNIANVHNNQGDYAKALEWYGKALAICERALGKEHPDTATTYNNIALVYHNQGDYPKALEWFIKSYKILCRLGEGHPNTIIVRENMESAYQNAGLDMPFEQWLQKNLDD